MQQNLDEIQIFLLSLQHNSTRYKKFWMISKFSSSLHTLLPTDNNNNNWKKKKKEKKIWMVSNFSSSLFKLREVSKIFEWKKKKEKKKILDDIHILFFSTHFINIIILIERKKEEREKNLDGFEFFFFSLQT